jgi:hypothetical protein
MPKINPDKSYAQVPLRLGKLDPAVTIEMPYGWLTELCLLVADKILNLNDHDKQNFIANMERLSGPDATYTLKAQLHESMIVIYANLASTKLSPDQKTALASKLVEGVKNCGPGFHDRINEAVESLSVPENVDDLLSILRHAIVSNAASQVTDEVHAKNRFSVIANGKGYGIRPFNENDVYHGAVSDGAIENKLKEAFDNHYTLFTILNGLQEQIQAYAKSKGYQGERKEGYLEKDIDEAGYRHFIHDRMRKSLDIECEECFLPEYDDNGITFRIVDIDWLHVKKALLKKLREEQYFTFEHQEEELLRWMESGELPLELSPEALSLFATPNELVQALVFYKEWPTVRKLELMHFYLANVKAEDEKAVLEKLEKTPELYRELKSDSVIQNKYLAKAVRENKLDNVKELVVGGADINPHLMHLVHQEKNLMTQWLLSDAALRVTITRDSLQGITETLINSKKGRQILLTDERLRGMCPDMLAGKSMNEWMQQAEAEKIIRTRDGFFVAANPLVQQFLQHIIYGEQAQAEKILKDYPQMTQELLTTKLKVKDYSGRKIFGTALQLALGAEDVRYHEDEICMVEMLTPYIKSLPDGEKIMAEQIAEQFPEGYEELEAQRVKEDDAAVTRMFDAIGASDNPADWEAALQEFHRYLKPKGVIKTGKHFNEKMQEKAYELYDAKYKDFGNDWDSPKNLFAWRRVCGGIQRYHPACLAQAESQGLYYIIDKKENLSRSLKLRNDPGFVYYPLDLHPVYLLGRDYAIGARLACGAVFLARARGLSFFQNFVEQKTRSLERLMPQREKQSGKCVVM